LIDNLINTDNTIRFNDNEVKTNNKNKDDLRDKINKVKNKFSTNNHNNDKSSSQFNENKSDLFELSDPSILGISRKSNMHEQSLSTTNKHLQPKLHEIKEVDSEIRYSRTSNINTSQSIEFTQKNSNNKYPSSTKKDSHHEYDQ